MSWIGEVLLNCSNPLITSEVGFLEPLPAIKAAQAETLPEGSAEEEEDEDEDVKRDVGRLDLLLLNGQPASGPFNWCAVEIQAVYFSGKGMKSYFDSLGTHPDGTILFPDAVRRPDYRSSGPKRLMPQLQIKVPTLRRWGKKLAVVVDRAFYEAMGPMDEVKDVSNCDIAWFIVDFEDSGKGVAKLKIGTVKFTTLERSVEGLTAGRPVPLSEFENRIKTKIGARQKAEKRAAQRAARTNVGANNRVGI